MGDNDKEDQLLEFEALSEIYPSDIFQMSKDPTSNLYQGSFIAHSHLHKTPLNILVSDANPENTIQINFLPPIICNFTLPSDYPSWSLPNFTYSSTWLNREHLESLNSNLLKLSSEHSSECFLWFWFEYLENEALYYLLPQLVDNDYLDLSKAADANALIIKSDRVGTLLNIFTEYNSQKEDAEFSKQSKECLVCGQMRSGSKFIRIRECGHYFCLSCVSNHYTGLIVEGSVNSLACLQCDVKPPHYQIKSVLSEEVFARYESLLYHRGLDCMDDIMYCPRPSCNMPVILETEDNMGICAICKFAFCAFCQKAFHGINACKIKNGSAIATKYSKASADAKLIMEKQYGRENLIRLVNEMKSETFVLHNTKSCPKCKVPTQKNDGCNKMACAKCGAYYCWLCLKVLDKATPYDHYSVKTAGGCFNKLFEGAGLIYEEEDE